MNKVKILFNSRRPFTTPALNEIFHHEKVNVSKTYSNKYNKLFVLCNSSHYLDTLLHLVASGCRSEMHLVASQTWRHWGSNPFCFLISK